MIPRCEHPRPDLFRNEWLCLNGEWNFDFWYGKTADGYDPNATPLRTITVPFCPESPLSGIGDVTEHDGAIYKRSFTLPASFDGKRTFLHFGACDYFTRVYINGKFAGEHKGGYTPFSFDITDMLSDGENTISLIALDDVKSPKQPTGKQTKTGKSYGCFYTVTTGIWQTVWLEARGSAHTVRYNAIPNVADKSVTLEIDFSKEAVGHTVTVLSIYEGKATGEVSAMIDAPRAKITLPLSELRPRRQSNHVASRRSEAASTGSAERHDGLAGKVV